MPGTSLDRQWLRASCPSSPHLFIPQAIVTTQGMDTGSPTAWNLLWDLK